MSDIIQNRFKNNCLIKKTELGKTKVLGYDIPQNIVFGSKDCIYFQYKALNGWQFPNPTEKQRKVSDYVQMNILGARQGIINSKDIQNFRLKNHVTKQLKEGNQAIKLQIPDEQFVYGKSNKLYNINLSQKENDIKLVIEHHYENESEQIMKRNYQNYENDRQCQKTNFYNRKSKSQKSIRLIKEIRSQSTFKIKKFQNVQTRINWSNVIQSVQQ